MRHLLTPSHNLPLVGDKRGHSSAGWADDIRRGVRGELRLDERRGLGDQWVTTQHPGAGIHPEVGGGQWTREGGAS